MAKDVTISTQANSDMEALSLKNAIQTIASNLNKANILYVADLCRKDKINEKFDKLKNNPLVKTML